VLINQHIFSSFLVHARFVNVIEIAADD